LNFQSFFQLLSNIDTPWRTVVPLSMLIQEKDPLNVPLFASHTK